MHRAGKQKMADPCSNENLSGLTPGDIRLLTIGQSYAEFKAVLLYLPDFKPEDIYNAFSASPLPDLYRLRTKLPDKENALFFSFFSHQLLQV